MIIESEYYGQIYEWKNRYADTGAAIGGALSMDPTRPVYGDDSMYDVFGGYYQNAHATSDFSDPNWKYTANKNTAQNPVAALEQKDDRANSNDFVGNVEVDYKFHFYQTYVCMPV